MTLPRESNDEREQLDAVLPVVQEMIASNATVVNAVYWAGRIVDSLRIGRAGDRAMSEQTAPKLGYTRDICAAVAFLFVNGMEIEAYDQLADPDSDLIERIERLVELRRETCRS